MRSSSSLLTLRRLALAATSVIALTAAGSASAAFVTLAIRGAPVITPNAPNPGVTTFGIGVAGQKAALGTADLDGKKMRDISRLAITRVDDYTRFAAGSGPRLGPYLNFWITDGAGRYAVAANEPTNSEWSVDYEANLGKYDFGWDYLKTKTVKFFENTDKSWLPSLGLGLTFADIGDFVIDAPDAAELTMGWTGLGTGAPRELLTNKAYGVNWVFGDTLANYVTGRDPGYQVRDAVATARQAIPEPGSLALACLALFGAAAVGRRRQNA